MSGIRPISSSVTLVQLVNFCKLVECRHFTDAARALYITQPTLSSSIKSLETALGVPLVIKDNSKRSVKITDQGLQLAKTIEPLLIDLINAIDYTREQGKAGCRTLRIGTIPTIQGNYLPALLRSYYEEVGYSAKVNISVGFTESLVQGLKRHEYDVIFCARVPEERDLEFIPVYYTPLVAVVSNTGPFSRIKELDLSDLEHTPFVTYDQRAPIGREVKQLFEERGIQAKPVTTFDDEFSLASFVDTQKGFMGIMTNTYELDSFHDRVKIIPIKELRTDWHQICLAYDSLLMPDETTKTVIRIAEKGVRI